MADAYSTLQLATPTTLAEANVWWEDVNRVFAESPNAEISVIEHLGGTYRITVHTHEQLSP